MERSASFGKTLTLKVKFSDFKQITRSKTLPNTIDNFTLLHNTTREIFSHLDFGEKKIRLLGLAVSQLADEKKQQAVQLELDF
jgi:DNA polymerase-4